MELFFKNIANPKDLLIALTLNDNCDHPHEETLLSLHGLK